MKNLNRFQKILLVVLVVCLAVGLTAMFLTRTISREPTAEELARLGTYDVLWDSMPEAQEGQTLTDRILAQAALTENSTVGENEYDLYTSDTLAGYLYDCQTLDRIMVSDSGAVFVSYTNGSGQTVILSYKDDSLFERSIYDPKTDILIHELEGIITVYEHFSSSAAS